jgi:hypothetical protein
MYFFYEQSPNLNIFEFEQILYLNNFRIWTIIILEQIFEFEQISYLNGFQIWTVFEFELFRFEQFSNLNIFEFKHFLNLHNF